MFQQMDSADEVYNNPLFITYQTKCTKRARKYGESELDPLVGARAAGMAVDYTELKRLEEMLFAHFRQKTEERFAGFDDRGKRKYDRFRFDPPVLVTLH